MDKVLIKGLAIVVLFFSIWGILSQLNWVEILEVDSKSDATEEKLGELFWEIFSRQEDEILDEEIIRIVDSILTKICISNGIARDDIKLHLVQNPMVNAFALPDGHLVMHRGLIKAADNQSQLGGVISHELAHISLNHVMKKLIREVGLSVLLTSTTGSNGTEVAREIAKMLSSTAFDRNFEKEADLKAVEYMAKANLNADELANFLFEMSLDHEALPDALVWLNTHPNSEGRAAYIIEEFKNFDQDIKPAIKEHTWDSLKMKIEYEVF